MDDTTDTRSAGDAAHSAASAWLSKPPSVTSPQRAEAADDVTDGVLVVEALGVPVWVDEGVPVWLELDVPVREELGVPVCEELGELVCELVCDALGVPVRLELGVAVRVELGVPVCEEEAVWELVCEDDGVKVGVMLMG